MVPPTFNQAQIEQLKSELPEWVITNLDGASFLQRTFTFEDFAQALDFTLRVGDIAEEKKYYPKLVTENKRVTVYWRTNQSQAPRRRDFIMAAKTDYLYKQGIAIRKARRKG